MNNQFFRTALALALCGAPLAYSQKPVATLSHSDSSFLKDAAEGSMDEVRLGEMAQQKASNDRVKAFGKHMVDDHSKMANDVQAIASQKNINLPADITITEKASNKLLSSKSGDSFDKSYMSAMLKDHKDDIQAFEKEANSGTDPDVRALASKALPTLREHLKMAEDVARQVGAE
jgi:putative membrane protein